MNSLQSQHKSLINDTFILNFLIIVSYTILLVYNKSTNHLGGVFNETRFKTKTFRTQTYIRRSW